MGVVPRCLIAPVTSLRWLHSTTAILQRRPRLIWLTCGNMRTTRLSSSKMQTSRRLRLPGVCAGCCRTLFLMVLVDSSLMVLLAASLKLLHLRRSLRLLEWLTRTQSPGGATSMLSLLRTSGISRLELQSQPVSSRLRVSSTRVPLGRVYRPTWLPPRRST